MSSHSVLHWVEWEWERTNIGSNHNLSQWTQHQEVTHLKCNSLSCCFILFCSIVWVEWKGKEWNIIIIIGKMKKYSYSFPIKMRENFLFIFVQHQRKMRRKTYQMEWWVFIVDCHLKNASFSNLQNKEEPIFIQIIFFSFLCCLLIFYCWENRWNMMIENKIMLL